ncbi:hypothetical protein EDB81DRAFT_769023 [Dactylonectria macrodidyma]|uniref:Uncharacterized protein n=1 Tax=Dactylonectria macrodidyma TaxID=307937 RepID=A0A9P9CZJ8_9HYPO|nr:hypothetical protein EDB81DRAFT_769023 [Dactylonectria macrodidyma]
MAEIISIISSAIAITEVVHEIVQLVNHKKQFAKEVAHQIQGYQHEVHMLKIVLKQFERCHRRTALASFLENNSSPSDYVSWYLESLELASSIVDRLSRQITASSKFRRLICLVKTPHDLVKLEERLEKLHKSIERHQRYAAYLSSVHEGEPLPTNVGLQENAGNEQVWNGRVPTATVPMSNKINNIQSTLNPPNEICYPQANMSCNQQSVFRSPSCESEASLNAETDSKHNNLRKEQQSWDEGWTSSAVNLPKWFLTTTWTFTYHYGPNILNQFRFRNYNVRASGSKIFLVVESGDLDEMFQLFDNGVATPFDRNEQGYSLLHCASAAYKPLICRKLLDLGLDTCIDEYDNNIFSPRQMGLWGSLFNHAGPKKLAEDIIQMFESRSGGQNYHTSDSFFWLGLCRGPDNVATLSRFQRRAAPDFFNQSLEALIRAVRLYVLESQVGQHPSPDVMTFLLGERKTHGFEDIINTTESRQCLLHTIAIGFARDHRDHRPHTLGRYEAPRYTKGLKRWNEISNLIIRNSTMDELHFVEHVQLETTSRIDPLLRVPEWTGTPFMSVLRAAFLEHFPVCHRDAARHGSRCWRRAVSSVIYQWLHRIKYSGIDLALYGKREQEAFYNWKKDYVNYGDFEMTMSYWSTTRRKRVEETLPVCLIHFEYGGALKHWAFSWRVDIEKLAGEFWDTVHRDNNYLRMPGAWVEYYKLI